MARKSKGFIELEWTCPNCETRNPGSEKACTACGAAQPDDVQFEAPTEKKFVSEEKASDLRKRGADIHCGFCGTRNTSTAETCSQCGADLSAGQARQAGREIDMPSGKPKMVVCPSCEAENSAAQKNCAKCGAPLPRSEKPRPAAAAAGSKAGAVEKKKPNMKLLLGIGAALLLCCAAIYFLFFAASSSVQATVSDLYWQTSVPVQEVQAVNYSNERGNPPSDAYGVSCHTESEEICEEKTVDRGDGFAEVVEDCHTESEQYCDYTVDEWTTIQTYTLDGHDNYPIYEEPSITSDQRTGDESVDLTVFFDTEKGQKSYTPDTVTEFQQFQLGSTWTLSLNALGGVVGVER